MRKQILNLFLLISHTNPCAGAHTHLFNLLPHKNNLVSLSQGNLCMTCFLKINSNNISSKKLSLNLPPKLGKSYLFLWSHSTINNLFLQHLSHRILILCLLCFEQMLSKCLLEKWKDGWINRIKERVNLCTENSRWRDME